MEKCQFEIVIKKERKKSTKLAKKSSTLFSDFGAASSLELGIMSSASLAITSHPPIGTMHFASVSAQSRQAGSDVEEEQIFF